MQQPVIAESDVQMYLDDERSATLVVDNQAIRVTRKKLVTWTFALQQLAVEFTKEQKKPPHP